LVVKWAGHCAYTNDNSDNGDQKVTSECGVSFKQKYHLKSFYRAICFYKTRTKKLGWQASSPLPPTYNVDNQVFFSLSVGKKRDIFQPLIRGDGGYVI